MLCFIRNSSSLRSTRRCHDPMIMFRQIQASRSGNICTNFAHLHLDQCTVLLLCLPCLLSMFFKHKLLCKHLLSCLYATEVTTQLRHKVNSLLDGDQRRSYTNEIIQTEPLPATQPEKGSNRPLSALVERKLRQQFDTLIESSLSKGGPNARH